MSSYDNDSGPVMDWIRSNLVPIWERLRYPIFSFVNLIALVFTLASGFSIFIASTLESRDSKELVYAITICLIVLLLLLVLLFREVSVVRRRRIASSISKQAEAMERLQTVWSVLRNCADGRRSLEISRSILQDILTIYSEIYGGVCGARCRVCIKLIETIDDEYYVYTLARDRKSARDNRHDDMRRQREHVDLLKENSDFIKLWSPEFSDEGFFFSRDLKKEKDYSSTSLNYRRNIIGDPNRPTDRWVLPYRSAIVWPIRQEADRDLPSVDIDRCVGFLAVDTARPGMLRISDAAIGGILARSLYPILDLFADVDRETAHQRQTEKSNRES